MSLLCSKFYNGSHFVQSKNGPWCSEQNKSSQWLVSLSVVCPPITSPASLLLSCSLTRWQPHWRLRYSLNVPGILPLRLSPLLPQGLLPVFIQMSSHWSLTWPILIVTPTFWYLIPLLKCVLLHGVFYLLTLCFLLIFFVYYLFLPNRI